MQMDKEASPDRNEILALTVEIVSAYAGNNALDMAAVPDLIGSVFAKLNELATDEKPLPETLTPAVPIRKSVTDDYIVCLEDGKKLKMLKRHLMTAYNMTPEAYRAKWGLKPDYPMVAPSYAATRQELAKKIGLGRKPRAPEPVPEAASPAKTRGRKKAVA
jgi:predicted transcriptional regulator